MHKVYWERSLNHTWEGVRSSTGQRETLHWGRDLSPATGALKLRWALKIWLTLGQENRTFVLPTHTHQIVTELRA